MNHYHNPSKNEQDVPMFVSENINSILLKLFKMGEE
jgi:hypothetical protein